MARYHQANLILGQLDQGICPDMSKLAVWFGQMLVSGGAHCPVTQRQGAELGMLP